MSDRNKETLQQIIAEHLQMEVSSRKFVGTLYSDVNGMNQIISYFGDLYRGKVEKVVALDGSGFILGGMLARELGVGFVPVGKNKESDLFDDRYARSVYINHKNESCALVVRKDVLADRPKVLVVDNWIETGATIQGILAILEDLDVEVVGVATFGMDENEKTNVLKKEISLTSIV